jgi:predicted MPP superfamily phosphohydrolase
MPNETVASVEMVPVEMVLEMKPSRFEQIRPQFIADLARYLEVGEDQIQIMAVRTGCTWLLLLIPKAAHERFRAIPIPPKKMGQDLKSIIDDLVGEYSIADPNSFPHAEFRIIVRPSGKTITWLHLSDLHMRSKEDDLFHGQAKVADTLIDQIPRLLAENALEPDVIFFTGDIAQSGEQDQYDTAFDFITRLKQSLPNGDATFISVPGNHDVHRKTVKRYAREEEAVSELLTDNERVYEFLTGPGHADDRERIFARLSNYFTFTKRLQDIAHPEVNHKWFFTRPYLSHSSKGFLVGIAGLNSAWRSGSEKDRYSMILGAPQIDTAIADLKSVDIRILCVHHPIESDWFHPSDVQYQRTTLPSFDFILRGHEHDPHPKFSKPLNGGETCLVSAGAIYTTDAYPNCFNVVQLNLDNGTGLIYFWRLSTDIYKWVPYVELGGGVMQFPLPSPLLKRLQDARNRRKAPLTIDKQKLSPLAPKPRQRHRTKR